MKYVASGVDEGYGIINIRKSPGDIEGFGGGRRNRTAGKISMAFISRILPQITLDNS